LTVTVKTLTATAMQDALPALAALRIEVFRAFPYLYDGSKAYEERYLDKLARAPGAVIVAAYDQETIVGAATGAPLASEHAEFIAPFRQRGIDPASVFYCAESVLLERYRGQGIGHRFFDLREAHARQLGGFAKIAFCGVVRDPNHPARPVDYRPLDAFWRKRGYAPVDGLVAEFSWRDIGDSAQTAKPMQFWMKDL